jgi:outer membrane protein assembly factor BamB
MEIKYCSFKNYADSPEVEGANNTHAFLLEHPDLLKLKYEMTCFCDRVVDGTLYAGCTHFAGDFLLALDIKSGEIRSCGYPSIFEENEHKIHRGIWYDKADNSIVFATSTLSQLNKLAKAPGGKFVRYFVKTGKFEILGHNEPGQYTQASVYDAKRRLLYLFSYRAQKFGVFNVDKKKITHNTYVESIPHIAALDDKGRCWSTYDHGHKWCCFDPAKNDFVFYDTAMESSMKAANIMYPGAGPIDSMINGGDGFLYIGTGLGELYRLDPETGKSEYLGRPTAQNRMPCLCVGPDGMIYAAGGDLDVSHFVRYDRSTKAFDVLGPVQAADGAKCYRPHDLTYHGGHFYIAETDNPRRSGFIWKVKV